jgi:hypothetical protein
VIIPDENDMLMDVVHEVIQMGNAVVLLKQVVDLVDDVELMIVIMVVVEVREMEIKLDDVFDLNSNDDDENGIMMMM